MRGQRLGFEAAQLVCFALAHISVEGAFVFAFGRVEPHLRVAAAEFGAGESERQLVHRLLLAVERAVDAVHLLVGHHIGRQLALDLTEAFVIGFLEFLERTEKIIERVAHLMGGGAALGFQIVRCALCLKSMGLQRRPDARDAFLNGTHKCSYGFRV